MTSRFITLAEAELWNDLVRRCAYYDVYHLAEYQYVATPMDTGTPVLAVIGDVESSTFAVLPLRLRRVNEVEAIRKTGEFGDDIFDAVSPYGYPGLIATATHDAPAAHDALPAFDVSGELDALLRRNNVVSAFIRQHPLFESASWFREPFAVEQLGSTVAIDLKLDEDEYVRRTRSAHTRGIRAWDRRKPTFGEPGHAALPAFARAYRASMRDLGADPRYHFDDEYFESLGTHLGANCRVFAARVADAAADSGADAGANADANADANTAADADADSMAIVLTSGSTAQFHLGATPHKASVSGLSRWLMEQIRRTLKQEGYATFHLGGGLGAGSDDLKRFKSGFSDWQPPYHVVRWIGDAVKYERLCQLAGVEPGGRFPAYRN